LKSCLCPKKSPPFCLPTTPAPGVAPRAAPGDLVCFFHLMPSHGLFEAVVRCLSAHHLPFSFLSGATPFFHLLGTLRALSLVLTRPLSLAILLLLYAVERQEWEELALCPSKVTPISTGVRVSKTLAEGRLGWADIMFALHKAGGHSASQKTVTRALRQLEKAGLVACHIEQESPRRCSYVLTGKAQHLCLFLHLMVWSQTGAAPKLPPSQSA